MRAAIPSDRGKRFEWAFAILLAAIAFGYAAYTKHVWEDYFITFRHSKNLAEGKGLVYQEGERVHGFTSPLGVLLPAAFHFIAGNPESFEPALWMFRIVSALAYAGAGFFLVRILRAAAPNEPLVVWSGALLFAVEFKSLAFSMNGQETAFMLFFLAWTLRSLQLGADLHWKALAVAWAGLQWTRPDGCILAAATAAATLVFFHEGKRGKLFVAMVKAGALSILIYSPWVIWTALYYGTPIPHTVTAKSGTVPMVRTLFGPWPYGLADRLRERSGAVFEPIYAVFGGWPDSLVRFARGVGIAGLVWWMIPVGGANARASRWLGASAFLTVLYLAFVMLYPWYVPPVAMLMGLSLVLGAFSAPRTFIIVVIGSWLFVECWDKDYFSRPARGDLPFKPKEAWIFVAAVASAFILARLIKPRATAIAATLGVTVTLGAITVCSWRQIAVQQEYVETRHRRAIGEWLKENVKPGETIYLECLGYIGYFCDGKMMDWPGLTTPAVVVARQRNQWDMILATAVLTPDWMVLRNNKLEYEAALRNPKVNEKYETVREFNAADGLKRDFAHLPGLGYLLHDAHFFVMRRRGLR